MTLIFERRRRQVGRCRDCEQVVASASGPDEWYMVHDDVWAAAGMEPSGGYLCIGCLARRLGRRLRGADFNTAPVNEPGPWDTNRLEALKRVAWHQRLMERYVVDQAEEALQGGEP